MNEKIDKRYISSMDAKFRVRAFRKDPLHEELLNLMNDSLGEVESFIQEQIHSPKYRTYPSCLLLGPPRSGTTLFTQLVATYLDVGYSSNLMARFYKNPLLGAYLQKTMLEHPSKGIPYTSKHGVTNQINEPHEFGYFWSNYFGLNNETHQPITVDDWQVPKIKELSNTLDDITRVFGKSTFFKCVIGVYFVPLIANMHNVCVVRIGRNFADIVYSILQARKERLGSYDRWWSLRPGNYDELQQMNPIDQVISQVTSIESSLDSHWHTISPSKKLFTTYDELVSDPAGTLGKVKELYQINNGGPVTLRGITDRKFRIPPKKNMKLYRQILERLSK